MKKITSIIFDLGGVILNINYENTINEFRKLGFKNPVNLYSQNNQQHIFKLLETGKIQESKIIKELQRDCNASKKQIINAWNAMLLDLPTKRIHLLKKLKLEYDLYLLSNTNSIHIKALNDMLGKEKYQELYNLFNKAYYSYEIKLRKPDPRIFHKVINENNLIPEETLFIDDSIQHIKEARNLKINCYHLQNNEEITDLFPDISQSKHH